MKVISSKETKIFRVGKNCVAREYPLGNKDIDIAEIKLTGRYPEAGSVTNEVCKEINYVIKGQGKIVIENQEFTVSEGDVVYLFPGEKYYWDGDLVLSISCSPAWFPEQHKTIS